MIYRGIEIDLSQCDYMEKIAIIPFGNGEFACIPEENATEEELILIQAIKDDIAARPIIIHNAVPPQPTDKERIVQLEDQLSTTYAAVDFLLMNMSV